VDGGQSHRPAPRRGHRYRSPADGARHGSEDAVTPPRRRFTPTSRRRTWNDCLAPPPFAVVPQIDSPLIVLRGCATAAKRQGHSLSKTEAVAAKPTRALID